MVTSLFAPITSVHMTAGHHWGESVKELHNSGKQIGLLYFSIVKKYNNRIIYNKKVICIKVNIAGQCIFFLFFLTDLCVHASPNT